MDVAAKIIDLFCGAGGLAHGLIQAGLEVVAGFDTDPACRWPFERNNPGACFHERDVAALTVDDLDPLWGDAKYRILVGCAPCQPFSTYAQGARGANDSK